MAKSKSIITLSGNLMGMTHVNSRTYGPHTRAPRGTYKPALLNDAMKESSAAQALANAYAKQINDQIKEFRADFKGGQFWQNMLSALRHQYKTYGNWDLKCLKGLEIHPGYPLQRICKGGFNFTASIKNNTLSFRLAFHAQPVFKSKGIDSYQVQILVIFPDNETGVAAAYNLLTETFNLNTKPEVQEAEATLPVNAVQYLICMKLEGCINGAIGQSYSSKGMQILDAGSIESVLS